MAGLTPTTQFGLTYDDINKFVEDGKSKLYYVTACALP